ncbi:hypothetical protein CBS101457_003824 [Exobasidium rhododendri]|nr:hypothetical protein CBS101457_003824 [Exobasidium rhododendri]
MKLSSIISVSICIASILYCCHAAPVEPSSGDLLLLTSADKIESGNASDSMPSSKQDATTMVRRSPAAIATHVKAKVSGWKAGRKEKKLYKQQSRIAAFKPVAAGWRVKDGKMTPHKYNKIAHDNAQQKKEIKRKISEARKSARDNVFAEARLKRH